jgi:hypothetical protein
MHRLFAIALLLAALIGCSKKSADSPGGAPVPEPRGVDSDPKALYSLKVRGMQEGDKTEVVRRESTTENRKGGNSGTTKLEKHLEYNEHILKMPGGAHLPTKLSREYKVAQKTDLASAQLQPLSDQGKTVTIEKRGAGYHYTIDGKTPPRADVAEFDAEFRSADKVRIEALLPGEPVKVGDEWPVDRAVLRAFGEMSPDVDFEKSTLKARLARAYTLDGKQWGQIAFDIDLVIDPDITGGKIRGLEGTRKLSGTFDVVIDGTSRDNILKVTVKAALAGRHKATETKSEIEETIEKSVRMVK